MSHRKEFVDRLVHILGYLTDDGKGPPKPPNSDFYGLIAEMFFACVLPKQGIVKLTIRNKVKSWVLAANYAGFPNLSDLGNRINEDVHALRVLYPEYVPKPADIGLMVLPEEVLDRAEAFRKYQPDTLPHKTSWKRNIKLRR